MEVRIVSGESTRVWTVEDQGLDGDSSMARTTGLVTFACIKAWSQQDLFVKGIHAPEDLPTETIHFVIDLLKSNGVRIDLKVPRGHE